MDRRRFLGAAAGTLSTALAGCSGGSAGSTDAQTDGDSTSDGSQGSNGTDGGSKSNSYSVKMAPVGKVSFDAVPEKFVVFESGYADMSVALGKADGLLAVGNKSRFHTDYYSQLDGVNVDKKGIQQLLGDSFQIDKELFYRLNADVHLIDPNWLVNNGYFKLEQKDVDEVKERIAPFVGNTIFRRTDKWHTYRYYSMYDAFEKVAEVFQEQKRYEAFKSLHDDYVSRVQSKLPKPDARPNALLTFAGGDNPDKPDQFYPYRLSGKGTNKKQFHDLGISDALANTGIKGLSTTDRGTIDYETMLEVDPDALLVRGHEDKSAKKFENTVVSFMKSHPVASELTAVKNDRVFRGGPLYQGPLTHLFTLERAAKDFFPKTFSGDLFARADASAVVKGEV